MKKKRTIVMLSFLAVLLVFFALFSFANAQDYTDDYIKSIKIYTEDSNTERPVERNGNNFTTVASSTESKISISIETGRKYNAQKHKIVVQYKDLQTNAEPTMDIDPNSKTLLTNAIAVNKRPETIVIQVRNKEGNSAVTDGEYRITVGLKAELAALQVKTTDGKKTYLQKLNANQTDYSIEIDRPTDEIKILAGNFLQKNSGFYSLKINNVAAKFFDMTNRTPLQFDSSGNAQIPIGIAIANSTPQDESTIYNLSFHANFDYLQFAADEKGTKLCTLDRNFDYNDDAEYTLKIPANQKKLYVYGVQKGQGAVDVSYDEKTLKGKYGFVELPECLSGDYNEKLLTIKSGDKEYKVRILKTVALDGLSVKNGAVELITDFAPACLDYEALVPTDCSSVTVTTSSSDACEVKINGTTDNNVSLQWNEQNEAKVLVDVSYGNTSSRYKLTLVKETESIEPILREEPEDVSYYVGDEAKALSVRALAPHNGELTYQWQRRTEDEQYKDIPNETQASYTPNTKRADEGWVRCKITNTVDEESKECFTRWVNIRINATKAETPKITGGSLDNKTYMLGEESTFLMAGTARVTDGGKVTIQWYVSESKDYSKGIPIELEQTSLCFPDTTSLGTKYYFYAATNTLQGFTATAYSDFAAITVVDQRAALSNLQKAENEENTYLVNSLQDFQIIGNYVKSGNNLFGYTFKMTTDITLPADWKPIGALKSGSANPDNGKNILPFSGTIDGDGHKLTISENGSPLLGYVRQTTVKNLDIYGKKINGYGLIDNYTVDYAGGDYDSDFKSRYLYTATIENVRILSGTQILKSGFIGGFASGANKVYLRNCEVQEGVIIGYDGQQSGIGSLAGEFNGIVVNCKSKATVKGKNNVGGLVGRKGQSMGDFSVLNSSFEGTITATGKRVGGIVGGGYSAESAPNTKCVTIKNCFAKAEISAADYVGGIFGGEPVCKQCWENGIGYIQDNHFAGSIVSNGAYVGGIIGYMHSLDKYNIISNNYYMIGDGLEKGIGYVNADNVDLTTKKFGRSDDPLGTDCDKLTQGLNSNEFRTGKLLKRLNDSATSYKNWKQGDGYPIHRSEPVVYEISLSGKYKTTYETGQKLITDGVIITAKYSDGTTDKIDKDDKRFPDVKFTGFNSNKRGVQTITVTYGAATAAYEVTVLYPKATPITVFFTLLGDTAHGELTEATGKHTLKDKNLPETWVERTEVPITNNQTVYDVMKKVFEANAITWEESYGLGTAYIESLTRNGVTLGQFTNGSFSGWMYTLNGKHPSLGVAQQYLNGGEEIIFHYTDDYTIDISGENWDIPGGTVEEVKDVTTDTKSGTTTAPTEVKVSEKTNADGTKTKVADVKVSADNQKEILKQAKASKSKEIILNVSGKSVGDATKADVTLDKSFIDSIVKDTNAKLTIKTPFGDKTYTQDELKAMSEAATGSTVTVAIEKAAEEPTDDAAAKIEKAKSIVKDMKLVARSSKTAKKNIKAVLKSDTRVKTSIKELKDLGFTVKYRFYRSTKIAASYKAAVTKKTAAYTNTSGKKGTKYFYKVQVRVYGENGKLIAKTALKQCKYASRTWSKAR